MSEWRPAEDDVALRRYYAARAPEYDSVYLKPERQPDLRAIEAWLPAKFERLRLLEVACGTGHWTPWLARAAASVHAIDASAATLEVARARPLPPNVTLAVGDAYALPRLADPYEAAFAGFWISHVPRRRLRGFLEGLCGVLRTGAPVVLLDNRYVEGSSTPVSLPDEAGDTWQLRPLADGSVHRVLKNFPEEAELVAALRGLAREVVLQRWTYYWALCFTVGPSA